ncbi:MAG: hypothetical protein PWP52_2137 [Bacteroidales bacterium]|nr:hypothetical protein [Bacteroidales bacterium]
MLKIGIIAGAIRPCPNSEAAVKSMTKLPVYFIPY